ncbi:MAG: L,D-transpeptidase family protein [Patescibacteria group bacterium]
MLHFRSLPLLGIGILLGLFCLFPQSVDAKAPLAGLYSPEGKLIRQLPIPAGAHVTAADLGNDGVSEILVGSPAGSKPLVRLLRLDGSTITKFPINNVKGNPAVYVTAGDVDGDGVKEIIVNFGSGTTPEIRVYTVDGKRLSAFLVVGKKFRGGTHVTVGDVNGDGKADIVTAPGQGGGSFVVTFSAMGKRIGQFRAYPANVRSGVQLATVDINGDGKAEIATVVSQPNTLVKVFSGSGTLLNSFKTVSIAPNSLRAASAMNAPNIIVGSAAGKTSVVTSYTADGSAGQIQFTPFGKNYTSGISVAPVSMGSDLLPDVIVTPDVSEEFTGAPGSKRIVIDISDQRMRRYEGTRLVDTHLISTGKWSTPTPLGAFTTQNKIPTAYSRRYALYMDNWMAITPDGAYGIHSLPYRKLKNGGVYYEGVAHLGKRVSHGCIRLSPKESAEVFKWASVGTSVTVKE